MTAQEKAKRWILSKCSGTGESVNELFSEADLPSGVTIDDIQRAFGKLRRDGRINGRGVLETGNAGYLMQGLECLE